MEEQPSPLVAVANAVNAWLDAIEIDPRKLYERSLAWCAARPHPSEQSKGMCCNFENGDVGRADKNWAARFQAARSNSWSMN